MLQFVKKDPIKEIQKKLLKNGYVVNTSIVCVNVKTLLDIIKEKPSVTKEQLENFWENSDKYEFPRSSIIRTSGIFPSYNFLFYRWENNYYEKSLFYKIAQCINIYPEETREIAISSGEFYAFIYNIKHSKIESKKEVATLLLATLCSIYRCVYENNKYDTDFEYKDSYFVVKYIKDILLCLETAYLRLIPYSPYSYFGNQTLENIIHPFEFSTSFIENIRSISFNNFLALMYKGENHIDFV